MIPRFAFLLAVLAFLACGMARAACGAQDDFLARADPLLAPIRPIDCATVLQTPPDFTWPPHEGHASYTLTLRFPDGHTEKRTTPRNFVAWPRALAPGNYAWSVKGSGR